MSNILLTPAMRRLLESDLQNESGGIYGLTMYWMGRFDKLGVAHIQLYEWITQSFIPADLLGQHARGASGKVLFAGQNHRHLAHFTINDARKYLESHPV